MNAPALPTGVKFCEETIRRIGKEGDNWCTTWAADDSQYTSMCDGNWMWGEHWYHCHLYRIAGEADNLEIEDVPNYPAFQSTEGSWFGFGILSVDGVLYSALSKTPLGRWSGPFRGFKLLVSRDDGASWTRCDRRGSERIIGYWNVRADSTQIVATFPGYSEFHIGPWEGNLSFNGKFMVIDGKKGDDRIAFAYDLATQRKYPDLVLNDVEVDWISVSPSGKHIVLQGSIDNEKGDQTQVYDLEGNKVGELWSEYGRPSHYDMTIDENGDDIAVGVSKSAPDDGRVIKRRLFDGKVTVLTTGGGYASHTSTRNVNRPGWAYVTYQHPGPTWPPYWDEVVAVKLDGSMTVERIAHLHTKRVDYLTEAHAVPSPDGKRVLWASTWEAASGRPIGTYIAHRIATHNKPEANYGY